MSDDLVAFLSARISEDEAVARLAISDPERGTGVWFSEDGELAIMPSAMSGGLALHVVNQRPQRALREVAAKRAIITEYENLAADDSTSYWHAGQLDAIRAVIRRLCLIYADHPDHPQD